MIRFSYISDYLAWNHKVYISPKLVNYLRTNLSEYDVIHLQDLLSIHAFATSIYSKKKCIPYIITVHGSLPWLFKRYFPNYLVSSLIIDKILGNASKIVALNKVESDQLRNLGINSDRIEIIPNGITAQDYKRKQLNMGFREKYSVKEYEKIIIYVGRIHKSKGIDLLIRAFWIISKNIKDIKLVIIGTDDGHLPALVALTKSLNLSNKVIFTGFLNNNEKINAMQDADVFVTTKFSGFPITFLESCACGLPIVTTFEGDNLDWINNNVGYVVEYNDIELAKAISKILCDNHLREKFSYNGKKMVDNDFSWSQVAKKMEKLYYSVL